MAIYESFKREVMINLTLTDHEVILLSNILREVVCLDNAYDADIEDKKLLLEFFSDLVNEVC